MIRRLRDVPRWIAGNRLARTLLLVALPQMLAGLFGGQGAASLLWVVLVEWLRETIDLFLDAKRSS